MDNQICANQISFKYGRQEVLKGVSLCAEKGRITAILGPNGSGKSTLIKCISGLFKPFEGDIYIQNQNLKRLSMREKAKQIGYVPQSYHTDLSISIFEMILLGLEKNQFDKRESYLQRVEDIIQKMKLEEIADANVNELSGGQLQKVTIARALVKMPDFLMMDEPTSGLDIQSQREVMQYLQQVSVEKQIGVVCIVHDINFASRMADHIVLMKAGVVIAQGRPEEVITPQNMQRGFGVESKIIRHLDKPHMMML